jgi:hypothetical protein
MDDGSIRRVRPGGTAGADRPAGPRPENNRLRNLRSLCQRCHMIHGRNYHLAQRWITYRLRYAVGDIFLGPYRSGADRFILSVLIAQFAAAASSAVVRETGPARPWPASSLQLLLDIYAHW